jgi:hypothetical protein
VCFVSVLNILLGPLIFRAIRSNPKNEKIKEVQECLVPYTVGDGMAMAMAMAMKAETVL